MYAVPGGNLTVPQLGDFPTILGDSLIGQPRTILLLLGWTVGDTRHQQVAAAIVISTCLALLTVCIYVVSSQICCSKRMRQHQAASRRVAEGELRSGQYQVGATEVARSRSMDDPALDSLWTVHNRRYDLNDFVARHPGGIDAISLGKGRNCTELFESYHSLANEKLVRAVLARYYVEDAKPHDADFQNLFEWQDTPFFDMLKARVRAHFEQTGGKGNHYANRWQSVQLLIFTIASCLALSGFMCGRVLPMLFLPFCYWWGPSPCMHDGSHFSLSRRPWVNRMLAHIGGAHMSLFAWYHQHTIGHHVHTNMPGRDPDLYHFCIGVDQGTPGFRSSIESRTLPEKTWQGTRRSAYWRKGRRLRVPLSTFGPSLIWDIQSLVHPTMRNAFMGIIPYQMISDWQLSGHSVGRSLVIWLAIIHPITVSLVIADGWCSGFVRAAIFVTVPYAIHGCLFYTFSQLSHIQEQCFDVKVDEGNAALWHHHHPYDKMKLLRCPWLDKEACAMNAEESPAQSKCTSTGPREWAVHQVEHCLDYAVESKFWLHASNGLNLQVVHHLFPQVGWGHHRELSLIIRDVCRAFDVTYSMEATFWAACMSHCKHLARINDGPLASVWVQPPPGYALVDVMDCLDQVDRETVLRERRRKQA